MSLTQLRCKELWNYDEHTGIFWSRRYKGVKVGSVTKAGYTVIEVGGRQYLAHRLTWLYCHGTLPETLDHIDGCRSNNTISNLRVATTSENAWNMQKHRDNTSGIKGVCPTGKGTYRAYVNHHGKMYQAYFKTVAEAQAWVVNKRAELHGVFKRN